MKIPENARQTPVVGEFDVVVCGGGPAGVAAAVAAARSGARPLLLEQNHCLGGIWTAGAVT
jgi:flavin-dependent dehydrogenase